MPILYENKLFTKIALSREDDFELIVANLSDQIFGSRSIYIEIKKKIRGNNIAVIPDGYLIDMTNSHEPGFYVVENEIVRHDPFSHIGIQMLKFSVAFEGERILIRNILMNEINQRPEMLIRLHEACAESGTRNIDNYLDKAVYGEFKGLVLIDEAKPELYKVIQKINADISVLQVKTFKNSNNEYAYEFDTLYEYEEEEENEIESEAQSSSVADSDAKQRRRQRRAQCDTIVVPAREEGFAQEFLGNNQWYAVRIGAAMKDRIKYIAAYRVAPVSAVTHLAEVHEIRPYHDSGKYLITFKDKATEIEHKKFKDSNKSPQGPIYIKKEDLLNNSFLDEGLEY